MFILSAFVFSLAASVVSRPIERAKMDMPFANIITRCTEPNMVALTFDEGPYQWGKIISDTLTAAGPAKGTFFYNGKNYVRIHNSEEIDIGQYVYSQGHQIPLHTWRNPSLDLAQLTWDQINDQMSLSNGRSD